MLVVESMMVVIMNDCGFIAIITVNDDLSMMIDDARCWLMMIDHVVVEHGSVAVISWLKGKHKRLTLNGMIL